MALKGTIYGTTSNQWIDVKIEWSATQSVSSNSSKVKATVYYTRTNTGYETHGNWRGSITIDGNTESFVKEVWINENGWEEAGSYSKTVYHNTDGTKSLTISASGKINNTSLDSTSISGTITLDRIIRNITLSSAPNFTDESNPVITYDNPAGNGASSLQACISFDGVNDDIPYRSITKTGTSYIFNFTDEERTTLRTFLKDATSGTVHFIIKAVIGGSTMYSSLEKTLTIVNAMPTLNPKAEDINATTLALTGDSNKFIKYHSQAGVASGAAAVKNATLKNTRISCGAKVINALSGNMPNVEEAKFVFSTTDSRGNTTTQTLEKTLIEYVKLSCNLNSTPPSTEGNMSFTISGNYYSGSFGVAKNTITLEYRYKVGNGSYTNWIAATPTISGNTYSFTKDMTGLNYQEYYTFQARAKDKLATVLTPETEITGTPIFTWSETDFDFNVPVNFNRDWLIDGVSGSSLTAAVKALSNTFSLETIGTAAANYTSFETSNVVLIGNMLYCYFTATRNANFTDGNIANEIIGNLTINHGGKIKSMYNVGFASAGGVLASLTTINANNTDTTLSFDISISATSSAGNTVNASFIVPVSINLENY